MKRTPMVTLACLLSLTMSAEAGQHKGAGKQSRDQAKEMSQDHDHAGKRKGEGHSDADSDSAGKRKGDGDSDVDSDSVGKAKSNGKPESDGRGNEQSVEMQQRSEERKQIQEEYRSDREPGQEGRKGQDDAEGGQKSWWKFWE